MATDISPEMAKLARRRIGDRATVLVADLGEPLSFAQDASFDLVVGSLVLHYLRDWTPVLSEFRRVLTGDGVVVFSTHHPRWTPNCRARMITLPSNGSQRSGRRAKASSR